MTFGDNDNIQVAYLHPNKVSHCFMSSYAGLFSTLSESRTKLLASSIAVRSGTGQIADGRNMAVREFLERTDAGWLLMLDADMGFPANTLDILRASANPTDHPVVGALCFGLIEYQDNSTGGWRTRSFPVIYDFVENDYANRAEYDRDSLIKVDATGAACLLMHRSALASVRDTYGEHWFSQFKAQDGRLVGEDLSFCHRLMMSEIPLYVNTSAKTCHQKSVWVDEEYYLKSRR